MSASTLARILCGMDDSSAVPQLLSQAERELIWATPPPENPLQGLLFPVTRRGTHSAKLWLDGECVGGLSSFIMDFVPGTTFMHQTIPPFTSPVIGLLNTNGPVAIDSDGLYSILKPQLSEWSNSGNDFDWFPKLFSLPAK